VANRTFLTSHARALLCIAHDLGVRLRDIAASLGITERSAYGTVTGRPRPLRGQTDEQTPQPLPDPGTPDAPAWSRPHHDS